MFIERNKNRIKRRQHFWFALLLSRLSDLWLTERKKKKKKAISPQKNLFHSKVMKCHCWENAEEIAQDSLGMACAGQWSQVALSIFQHHSNAHGGQQESWARVSHRYNCIWQARLSLQQVGAALEFLGWFGTAQCPPLSRLAGYQVQLQTCFDWNVSALSCELPQSVADTHQLTLIRFLARAQIPLP